MSSDHKRSYVKIKKEEENYGHLGYMFTCVTEYLNKFRFDMKLCGYQHVQVLSHFHFIEFYTNEILWPFFVYVCVV